MCLYFQIGLKCKQVCHSKDSRVDRGRVFYLECTNDGSTTQPQHVNLLYGIQSSLVIVERQTPRGEYHPPVSSAQEL